MDELLVDFRNESETLVAQMTAILEDVETDFSKIKGLEQYGQIADRIMGGSKSLLMAITDNQAAVKTISNYTELCKAVGYQASQIVENDNLLTIVIALLLDATELLQSLVTNLGTEKQAEIKEIISETLLARLKWASEQFDKNLRVSVAVEKQPSGKLNQDQINALLKQLGL